METLTKIPAEKIIYLFRARQRRKLSRGIHYRSLTLIQKIRKMNQTCDTLHKTGIQTHIRDMVIVPEMIGTYIKIHNGKSFSQVELKSGMIGRYLGEFSFTYRLVNHSKSGAGGSKTSKLFGLK